MNMRTKNNKPLVIKDINITDNKKTIFIDIITNDSIFRIMGEIKSYEKFGMIAIPDGHKKFIGHEFIEWEEEFGRVPVDWVKRLGLNSDYNNHMQLLTFHTDIGKLSFMIYHSHKNSNGKKLKARLSVQLINNMYSSDIH